LSDATIFKPVILAWMPESSTMDGNCMIICNIIFTLLHILVTGFQHPCWNDGGDCESIHQKSLSTKDTKDTNKNFFLTN